MHLGMSRKRWLPIEDKALIRMRLVEKRPLSEIAVEMGRTLLAVRSRVHHLMITTVNIWNDPTLTERLIAYRKAGDTYDVIAAELSMRPHQVRGRARRLQKKGLL
jgi:predicted transcriptional regulator